MSLITPALIVIAGWWVGTGAVLYLQQLVIRPSRGLKITLALVSCLSLTTLLLASTGNAAWQSYTGFVAALVLWGCIELSYYAGLVGGVHQRSCPEKCSTSRRFLLALGASIWHEISVLFAGGLVMTLLLGANNPAGLYSFLVLWLMRWSAKLNLFFGVPNFNTDWFPKRLAYAHTYIRRAPVTLFFPVSVALASFVAYQLITRAMDASTTQPLAFLLPAVLLLLAILEHLFMALPIADSKLWDRIFVREEQDNTEHDIEHIDIRVAHRIQARTQKKIQTVLGLSNKTSVSVSINDTEPATQSMSQS